MTARVISVNVGRPVPASWAGDIGRTAIHKHPVEGPVRVAELGLDGDQVADTAVHGGIYQAVYAFAREDLDRWGSMLGASLPSGQFGENLTTEGIDVNDARVGERWRVGTVELEVVGVRIPCNVFKGWMGVNGLDDRRWQKRFTADGRPGPYLRVTTAGRLSAGDELDTVHRPDHDVTVSMMFRALTTERTLMPRLLDVGDALPPETREAVERYVDKARNP